MARVTQQEFLRDVRSHAMTIERDDGIYRHIRFQQSESQWLHRFEIITWPGALCIRGDVGTYVFSRVADMFEFFRSPLPTDGNLYINDGYWSEKLIASDCSGRRGDGAMRFDPDLFCEQVKRLYVEHVRENMRGMPDERRALRSAIEDEVLSYADSSESEALGAAQQFEHDGFRLQDFWEVECRSYTAQFIWSLYAISWAIRQYDASKVPQPAASAA